MKRIGIVYVVLCVILLKISANYFINERFISNYNKGEYDIEDLTILSYINFPEPYILQYNQGNIYYQNGDFDTAISKYEKALDLFPTKNKECCIRINLALAMLKKINFDDINEENKDEVLSVLAKAKDILCEKGCANRENDEGHSEEAEKLKADIEKMEEKLKDSSKKEKEKSKDGNDKENKDEIKDKKEQLKQIQNEANKQRQEEVEYTKELYDDKPHYTGKKW